MLKMFNWFKNLFRKKESITLKITSTEELSDDIRKKLTKRQLDYLDEEGDSYISIGNYTIIKVSAVKPVITKPIVCKFCNKKIQIIVNRFFCPYCKNWHCEEHRLPEEHSCPNPTKPPELKGGRLLYTSSGKTIYLTK